MSLYECVLSCVVLSDIEQDDTKPSDEEKHNLREEFTSIMQQKFLNGEDNDFNYEYVL